MKTILYLLTIALIFWILWIRFGPHNVDKWHVDPGDPDEKGRAQVRLVGREAPRFAAEVEPLLEKVIAIAKSEQRTRIVDGDAQEGMITFAAYSLIGFRDYITVKAVGEAGGLTKLAIVSRSRAQIGYDWGVNQARIDRWLQELKHTFPE